MVGSTIIAVTLVPVLCTFLIRGRLHREEDNPVMRVLRAVYAPVLRFALRHRVLTLASAALLFALAIFLAGTIGSEFMPPLDEETAMWMPVTDPSISLSKATELLRHQDRIISQDPAVASVVGKIGRAETSTDPAPINMTETIIAVRPLHAWFYPGHQFGIEFAYPEKRAVEIAEIVEEHVIATKEPEFEPITEAGPAPPPTVTELLEEPLVAVEPGGAEVAIAEVHPEVTVEPSPEVIPLPKTATPFPLIALVGFLAAGFASGFLFLRK